ncbi:C40 family peptidase [Cytobacillus oceanisediminis]|uniref:NlpC/P60 family protein n=1 Tax=Cytobacillus oceanisediminis TaxID=665099 RepID=A0A562K6T9_9BACI|nr:C40 family peptidase [Cytobacillus oceanisediminis]TWH90925.1 NlpC/P60 family protein [Cytobacillus oceanisediminis]
MAAEKIINTGLKYLGKPYVFNASSFQTKSFDCSSFIQYIFSENGIPLPRNSRQQFQVGERIPFHSIKKGDLLFFTTKKRRTRSGIERIGHVALYLGENKMLHTYREGKKVQITSLNDYWRGALLGARRVI